MSKRPRCDLNQEMDSFRPSVLALMTAFITVVCFTYPRNITAEPGQNVSLPCRAPDSNPIIAVEWSRSDLGSKYVFLFRNYKIDLEHQHLSFKNRVYLQESQLKVGDMSLFLRNVTTEDKGTYECRFIQTETNRRKVTSLYINLDVVSSPGEPDRGNALLLGLVIPLPLLFIIIIIGFVFKIKKNSHTRANPNRSPKEPDGPQQSSEVALINGEIKDLQNQDDTLPEEQRLLRKRISDTNSQFPAEENHVLQK